MAEVVAVTTDIFILMSVSALSLMTVSFTYAMSELRKARFKLKKAKEEQSFREKAAYSEGYEDGIRQTKTDRLAD